MIAITGITGRIGGQLADRLLADGIAVRAVMRNARNGDAWRAKGCEVAVAELSDASALAEAFDGVEAVFILPPPVFDPEPGFSEAYKVMTALREVIRNARVSKVLYLSTIGAQAAQTNLLTQHTIGESIFGKLDIPVTYLRPAWFLENTSWDIASARDKGVIQSFLQPLDKPFPMVAIADISRLAAELIQQSWKGHRVVELEGPGRISPVKLGEILTNILHRPVEVQAVPRSSWETLFLAQGMRNPYPRIRMLDGFNESWIEFEGGPTGSRKGDTTAETVLRELVDTAAGA
jgi:NAD(P)H dehydrogenase (quinone)